MRTLILGLALLGFGGCTVSQISPPLDFELTEEGIAYLAARGHSGFAGGAFNQAKPSMQEWPLNLSRGKVWVNSSDYQAGGVAMPYVLTIGIIPANLSGWFEQVIEVEHLGERKEVRTVVRTNSYSGWIACLMWISPKWDYQKLPDEAELKARAFITAINQLAAGGSLTQEAK